jgi:hypothetical protein
VVLHSTRKSRHVLHVIPCGAVASGIHLGRISLGGQVFYYQFFTYFLLQESSPNKPADGESVHLILLVYSSGYNQINKRNLRNEMNEGGCVFCLSVDILSMGNRQNLYYLAIVVNTVNYSVISIPDPKVFSFSQFFSTKRSWVFFQGEYFVADLFLFYWG